MLPAITSRTTARRVIVWLALVVLVLVLGFLLLRLAAKPVLPLYDFIEYWTAGRLNLQGVNPYNPDQLQVLQRQLGWTRAEPDLSWNPPWTLVLLMPFSAVSYGLARLMWLLLNILAICLACLVLWRLYGGSKERWWLPVLLGLLFVPSLDALKLGQISPFLLLGIAGFLYFARRGCWWQAGACAALVAIKPQLLYLFWIALVFWVMSERTWAPLAGLVLALGAGLAIAMLPNPQVLAQFIGAAATGGPSNWLTPTGGALLRLIFGLEHFWLQFVPPILGTAWFLAHWARRGATWSWLDEMPLLLLVSFVTTAYGWVYDQSIILVAVIQLAVWWRRQWQPLVGYIALQAILWVCYAAQVPAHYNAWLAPATMLLYLGSRRLLAQTQPAAVPVVRPLTAIFWTREG